MASITALRARGRSRVEIELDGVKWRTLPAEVVVRIGLSVGEELSRPRVRELRRELRRSEAFEQATRALRYRDLSSRALRERLGRRRTAPFAREEAVTALEEVGVVDDRRVARTRAERLAGRGMGDAAIRFDLAHHGVPAELVSQALSELEPEGDRARRLVIARGVSERTAQLLARRGFGEDAIETALASLGA